AQDDELSDQLERFSLSENEAKFIDIAHTDITLSAEECSRSLFGKIIGDRAASWIGVKRTMSNIWRLNQSMEIKELSPNYFQFIFQCKEDLQKVSAGIHWSFENQYLVLKEWRTGISSKHSCFNELNIWVQVTNVPLNWLSTEVGLKIGKAFKHVKNVVLANAGNHGGKIMKLLVTLNLEEPLPRVASIRLGEQAVKVGFKYEKLLNLCHYCGKIGHLDRTCSKRFTDINNNSLKEGQYGDFMKAHDTQRWFEHHNSGSRGSPQPDSPAPSDQGSPPRTQSQQAETSQQIIIMPQSSPSKSAEKAQDSCTSATPALTHQKSMIEAPLQIVEAGKDMEVDARLLPESAEFIVHNNLISSSTQNLKTWRRDRSKDGRLLRNSI
ncbi:Unknown protein, partial [Striga hermonthica]